MMTGLMCSTLERASLDRQLLAFVIVVSKTNSSGTPRRHLLVAPKARVEPLKVLYLGDFVPPTLDRPTPLPTRCWDHYAAP